MSTNNNPTHEHAELLHRYQTAQSVIIPREVFEELYLEPTARKKGTRLGTIFGNPTPMCVIPLCPFPTLASVNDVSS